MLPHAGQGAAQALTDAVALSLALTNTTGVQEALRRYEIVRATRTRKFVMLSRRIARNTTTGNPVVRSLRTAAHDIPEERKNARSDLPVGKNSADRARDLAKTRSGHSQVAPAHPCSHQNERAVKREIVTLHSY